MKNLPKRLAAIFLNILLMPVLLLLFLFAQFSEGCEIVLIELLVFIDRLYGDIQPEKKE